MEFNSLNMVYRVLHHPVLISYHTNTHHLHVSQFFISLHNGHYFFAFFKQEKESRKQARMQDNGATASLCSTYFVFCPPEKHKKMAAVLQAISF